MSGHSKWAKIHRQKGAADAKRANLFTKLSKNITLAARNGGDPEMNFALRLAVDKAKAASMPKDNIEKAIKRGTGELDGGALEEVMYEAYGPGGLPLLIEGVTDNKNRTTPEVKAILTKNGGSLGAQNSVKWMFEHKGVIFINNQEIEDKDDFIMQMIDAGAEDVREEDDGLTIYTGYEDFEKVKKVIDEKNIGFEYAEMDWILKDEQEVEKDAAEKLEKIIELLEDHDDVNSVYSVL